MHTATLISLSLHGSASKLVANLFHARHGGRRRGRARVVGLLLGARHDVVDPEEQDRRLHRRFVYLEDETT